MRPAPPALSIIIVSWNTKDLLRACLASIQRHPPSVRYEVIVVDNCSRDGTADMVRQEFPRVILVALPTNTGYARGNNHGFEEARGEYLLTLNPDTEFVDASLERAVRIMEENPHVGVLGAKQIGIKGEVQASVRGFPTLPGIFGDVTGLGRLFPASKLGSYRMRSFDYDVQQEAPQPMGTFLLFRRAALAAVGHAEKPFDEGFPIFFNEVDLLYRLKKKGWPCLYAPGVRVLHHGGASTKQVRKNMIWESHRSLVRFLRKHMLTQWNLPVMVSVWGIIYLAAFVRARGWSEGFRAG
ncbi:MAG TPA: glycosyltransferase family 2 protein [Fimbriimonadaceae bacterium]|nr:glycosyltransferase family 2 protein [Fimbriimonadaceae bacterium]